MVLVVPHTVSLGSVLTVGVVSLSGVLTVMLKKHYE